MLNNQIDAFIGCDSSYAQASTVLFGAPFDGTTSFRPGARFAGRAIRGDSFGIETYSPYQDRDLADCHIFDAGDLELPFGNTARVLDMIEERAAQIWNDGKRPMMIGGEHLVTLGAVCAAAKRYKDLHIIHFDAHADLRDQYLGETLSHATVIRRAWELVGDGRIMQLGIRSGEKQEFDFAAEHTFLHMFDLNGIDGAVARLRDKPLYITLDLDVLDPSIFPGTGTPEAGGVSFTALLGALLKLRGLNIVGCDMTELSPVYDQSGVSTAVACKILRELLLILEGE